MFPCWKVIFHIKALKAEFYQIHQCSITSLLSNSVINAVFVEEDEFWSTAGQRSAVYLH